jgi:hypothetical protein
MAYRIFLLAVSQNGKNGLVGHLAQSFVCNRTIDLDAPQTVWWIKLHYCVHLNRKSKVYGDCLFQPVGRVRLQSGLNGWYYKAQSATMPQIKAQMTQYEVQ